MTRRTTVPLLLLLALLLALPVLAQEQRAKKPTRLRSDGPGQGFHIAPHLNNITKDGATLIWETREPEQGVVEHGSSKQYGAKAEGEASATLHRVRISGLTAETEYHYRIKSGSETFEGSFKTAPAEQRPITFVVIGDSRRWSNRWAETGMEAHAAQWNPEFYLTMGDLVPNGHEKDQWTEHFDRFEGLTSRLWMATARGNHEGSMIFDPANDWFAKYHELPGKGEPFAAFQWGNTYFVLVSFESTANAYKFIDEELPGVDAKYKILSHHFPVYCTGYFGAEDNRKENGDGLGLTQLAAAIDRHKIDLDLVGHTHIYERLHALKGRKRNDREGTMYVVNGGDIGGNYPDWFTAVGDDRETMDQPTYTVYHMGDDRVWFKTFCWGKEVNKIIEIDYLILWKDEAIPSALLSSLDTATGDALLAAITDLGAMTYEPAAARLVPYLDSEDEALRRAAANAVRAIGTANVSSDLVPHIGHSDLSVRRAVARALEIAMEPELTPAVLAAINDSAQDEKTRISLIGALQFHGPAEAVTKAMFELLAKPDVTPAVRERASYCLSRTASEGDLDALYALFRDEPQSYVAIRTAWGLNRLTGDRQSLDKRAPIGQSSPGTDRDVFIQNWKKKLEIKKKAA